MNALLQLNLIHFLDFYFAFMFFVGTLRRLQQYKSIVRLVLSHNRWPRLVDLIKRHPKMALLWGIRTPALLTLVLMLAQLVASRFVFPEAGEPPDGLTLERLWQHGFALVLVVPLGLAMVAYDLRGLLSVWEIDRTAIEKQLDDAEFWLGGRADLVRIVTFGYMDPRRIVSGELQKALEAVSQMLNESLWWFVTQFVLRIGFGLSLWVTWAITHYMGV